ncbi:basic blue protein-like [Curcuma longa]|uniref:basic blue protein-like n=1 Tax=Curcuma longa TaxID=136217 RepID=UPI003D9E1A36
MVLPSLSPQYSILVEQLNAMARSAIIILAFALVGHCLLGLTEATDFVVGGATGWKFNVIDWPNGKSFKAGDVLVFNYTEGAHNVVVVTEEGYDKCLPLDGKVFTSGKDRVTLVKGDNHFICSFTGHCESNMKIKVTAA